MLTRKFLPNFKRFIFSRSVSNYLYERLKDRSLLMVKGKDSFEFLQGLVTNDMKHLENRQTFSMYSMFLNTKGRVLYDAIIYRTSSTDMYYVECSTEVVNLLEKHLKMYRVRRKIDIEHLGGSSIYALFNRKVIEHSREISNTSEFVISLEEIKTKNILLYRDPRIAQLGLRIIAKNDVDLKSNLNSIDVSETSSENNYRLLRYSLGVPEGSLDFPVGNSFPLECNSDYLHGVSFHKGCYIGQELTARTHHTGVVRKRLMPIYFSEKIQFDKEQAILHGDKNLGKLKGVEGNVGLALLRVEQVLALKEFQFSNAIATVKVPFWWPQEAPKEKLNQHV